MSLIKTTDELKKFVNNVNKNIAFENLKSSISNAEMLFIIPAMSDEFFTELDTAYNAENPELSEKETKALLFFQNALAQYCMYLDLQTRIGTVGNAGYTENTSEKTTQVRQWVHFGTLKNHYWLAESWLDKGLEYLESELDEFTTWAESSAYTFTKELFFTGTSDFQAKIDIGNSRSTFLALRSWISDAEDIYIRPVLTDDLFELLKEKHKDGDLDNDEKLLLEKIKKALAHWAMHDGLASLSVSKLGGSIKVINTNDAITEAMAISKDDRDLLQKTHKKNAETFTNMLINHLNKVASETVFEPYYTQKVLTQKNYSAKPVFKSDSKKSVMI